MEPFVFVVGRGRSGTTLMRSILDSHPNMAIPDETHFIVPLASRRRRYEHEDGFDVDRFHRDLVAHQGFSVLEMSEGAARTALVAARPTTFPDAIRCLFLDYAKQRGKGRAGDKTPLHVLNIPILAGLFPDARFVHMIRDGRDVALSYLDVSWGASSIEENAVLWRRAVREGRRAGRRLGPRRYLEVRYEQLLEEPEATVRGLCEFVRLDFDESMLRYHERAHDVAGKMGAPEARQNLYLPLTKGLRDWRSEMEPDAVARFEVLAGDVLEEFGYERAVRSPDLRSRLRARRGWMAVHATRARSRVGKVRRRVAADVIDRAAGGRTRTVARGRRA